MKKVGKLPVNSRIFIDYTDKKPKIQFSYPRKDAFRQNLLTLHGLIISIILTLLSLLILYSFIDMRTQVTPQNCSTNINYTNFTFKGYNISYISNITLLCNNYSQTLNWNYGYEKYEFLGIDISKFISTEFGYKIPKFTTEDKVNYVYTAIGIFIVYMTVFGIFLLFLYLQGYFFAFTKIGSKSVPYLNKKMSRRGFYVKFKNIKSANVDIPLFSNVYLDYVAKKDYSKYLKRVLILEHPFSQIVKTKSQKKLKNVYLWMCQFQFSRIPKEGDLEVWFH